MEDLFFEDHCFYKSPIGMIRITENGGFITGASFVLKSFKLENFYSENKKKYNKLLENACLQLDEYFGGKRKQFDLSIKPKGTYFQRSAWEFLIQIPYGETRSYLYQANSIYKPKAMRAIGQANSKNPISIIIPCHRVIGKNSSMTGYAGGIDRKKKLLAMESYFMHEQNY